MQKNKAKNSCGKERELEKRLNSLDQLTSGTRGVDSLHANYLELNQLK